MSSMQQGPENLPIPNMAGKAMTVKGPIDPDQLGIAMMHEHLFYENIRPDFSDESMSDTQKALWGQKLTLENLYLARDRVPIADNLRLDDEQTAIFEVSEYQKAGGSTIVEVTSMGLGRDPLALRRLSDSTGLNIVMGSGWYHSLYHPKDMDQRTVEDLAGEIVRDVTVGVGATGIRSGIIGEIGIEFSPFVPNEIKCLRAAARASRATGAAISLHRAGQGQEKLQVIDIIEKEGGDPTRTIFGHSDNISSDMPLMRELLDRGVYIEFDLISRSHNDPLFSVAPTPRLEGGLQHHGTSLPPITVEGVINLLEAGFGDRILLSHDIGRKVFLKSYGGTGYVYIVEKLVPHLRQRGVTEEQINTILVENPKRVLTFVAPK